jgi:hypothetical protein
LRISIIDFQPLAERLVYLVAGQPDMEDDDREEGELSADARPQTSNNLSFSYSSGAPFLHDPCLSCVSLSTLHERSMSAPGLHSADKMLLHLRMAHS